MYSFDASPVFRGATYSDELQMVDCFSGEALRFDPSDDFVWRLFPSDPRSGRRFGCDYGFQGDARATSSPSITLTLGDSLFMLPTGVVQWLLDASQTASLNASEYRMTLDLTRDGQVCRILDLALQVMD